MKRYNPTDDTFRLRDGVYFTNIHDSRECDDRQCMIHNPTKTYVGNIQDWDYSLRETGLVERFCEHGIGHPDPDSVWFLEHIMVESGYEVHGCDGCCAGGAA